MSDVWLTKAEAAARFKGCVRKFEGLRKLEGFPQPRQLGKSLLWNAAELDAWLAAQPRQERIVEPDSLARGRIYRCGEESPR